MTDNVVKFSRAAWAEGAQEGRSGMRPNLYNTCLAFRRAPEFRGRIAYDEFAMRTLVLGPLPWSDESNRFWDQHDDNAATEFMQAADLQVKRETVQQAVETIAYESRYHPVRAYLRGLQWDGKKRLDKWLTYYLAVAETLYTRAAGRCVLIAAVARVMEPGCKVDNVLILEGKQDVGKSSLIRALAGPHWFTDEMADFGSKDAALQMRGMWIIELGELEQLARAELSRTKAFITRQVDRFRPPYGARLVEAPRECIFIGSTNRDDYLRDESGNRRFWPVYVNAVDVDAMRVDRDQLWAEAFAAFQRGEKWWLTDRPIIDAAKVEQRSRQEEEVWANVVMEWVSTWKTPKEITTTEILSDVCKINIGDQTAAHKSRVSRIMKNAGYEQVNSRSGVGGRRWRKVGSEQSGDL